MGNEEDEIVAPLHPVGNLLFPIAFFKAIDVEKDIELLTESAEFLDDAARDKIVLAMAIRNEDVGFHALTRLRLSHGCGRYARREARAYL